MTFKKNNLILHSNKEFRCICADKEVAVFAPAKIKHGLAVKTWYNKEMFVVSNDPSVNEPFKYESVENA